MLDAELANQRLYYQNLFFSTTLHQANQRILDAVGERLKINKEKILTNLNQYGNTSAATIPLVLDEFIRNQKIKKNDIILTSGFGAGLSWGAALLKWG